MYDMTRYVLEEDVVAGAQRLAVLFNHIGRDEHLTLWHVQGRWQGKDRVKALNDISL